MGLETIYDHADYRLMSARALKMLGRYGESNLFLRGIIPQIGLDWDTVGYKRAARAAGESKYPLSKMLSFSIDGITSFSAKPMRIIFLVGLVFLLLDIAVATYVFISYFFNEFIEPGWYRSCSPSVSRKPDSDGDRNSRRIHRQDIYRSKTASAL